ncbi:MAG: hypothetical protein COA88_09625 [Kordia sp.]|nr:MAG: hypothetical protein COA88_09625 [Kordia sp.]
MRYSFFLIFCVYLNVSAQVGIGTTTPNSVLDITASNISSPANTDGILIPRINAFPAVNPTAVQNSMLVYLSTDVGVFTKGFHYWDNSLTKWIPFSNKNEWEDTAAPVNGILASQAKIAGNDVIITDTGRLGIGTNNPTQALHISNGDIYMDEKVTPIIRMHSTVGSAQPGGALIIEELDTDWNGTLRFNTDPNAWEFLASDASGTEDMLMFIDAENDNKGYVRIGKMPVNSVSGADVVEVLEVLGSIKIGASPNVMTAISHNSTNAPSGGAGTMVFQASDNSFYGWNGTQWKKLDN